MNNTSTVSLRMDVDLKKQAEDLFADLGLNMSVALTMFVRQAVRERAIPFKVQLAEESEAEKQKLVRERMREAFKIAQAESVENGTNTMSMDEINAEIAACRREKRAE
ncbi:MAG: type II toxin-antitoxin system RelB/DinJ family antitoxin [Oscillospiraceae bacterium]|nr:type II toxin-antitoxin system RelB/DinJ family antitoxin [Oscillospiraceae bacterium]